MVRGRRKCKSRLKSDGGSTDKECSSKAIKVDRKFSRGVNGRLSHASPTLKENECITHYFRKVPSPSFVIEDEEEEEDSPITEFHIHSSPKLSQENYLENEETGNRITPHKIQLNEMPSSPSTALQQLRISLSPKKAVKSRRRLNPSQAGNQQVTVPIKSVLYVKQETTSHRLTEYFPVRRSERKTKRTVLQERQHRIEAAVLAGSEDGLEVHNFEGKGRGIVATRHFCKGEFVVEYAGELIDMSEAKQRERAYAQDQNTGCYMYYFRHRNSQYCVDATKESGRLGRLVNHSRNGNLLTKTLEIDSQPRLILIAREDISPGEEVTYDYGDRSKESIRYHPWLLS